MIAIKNISGDILLTAPVLKGAVSHEELMTSDYVKLEWSSATGEILPAGAYIEHRGERYSLIEPYFPIRKDELEYQYSPMFHSRVMLWDKTPVCIYTYEDDGITVKTREFDWDFLGSPEDALFIIQQAIKNETGEDWTYSMAEGLPETISLVSQSSSIFSVLSELAEQCKTEWWVEKSTNVFYLSKCVRGQKINLEVGVNVKAPTVNTGSDGYFTRYYAFGSTRNIDQGNAPSSGTIINSRLTLDPVKYPEGYKDVKGHFENGVFVSDLTPGEMFPKTVYFDDIFPSSKLTISGVRRRLKYRLSDGEKVVIGTDPDGNQIYEQYAIWYFMIPGMEFSEDLIIEGQKLSVAFKSGQLAGREFELAWHKDGSDEDYSDDVEPFVVKANEYEIILDESSGRIIPGLDYIVPNNGDEVILFNIKMPDEYTACAMLELERELDKTIAKEHSDNRSYEFNSYPDVFHKEDMDIMLGQLVGYQNEGKELETRVTMVEKQLDYNFEQKIRIGENLVKGSRKQLQEDVRDIVNSIDEMRSKGKSFSSMQRNYAQELRNLAARFVSASEAISMLQSAFDNFTNGINPVTVQTMMMLIGDQSLQFKFVKSREDVTAIEMPVSYDPKTKQLFVKECAIVHLTLGITSIQPHESRDISQFMRWDMTSFGYDSAIILTEPEKHYYLYAKVEKEGTSGTFYLSEKSVSMESEEGYYNLLVGLLNSEIEDTRVFIPMFGFTEISPGQIVTDVISSATGNLIIDLANSQIKAKDGARIEGNLTIGPGSSGLENLSEWQGKQQEISDAKEVAQNAQTVVDNIQVGGRNLLRNTEFLKTVINEVSQYTHVSYFPTVPIKPNTEYVFSVEKTEILAGSGFDQFSVALYDDVTETIFSRWLVPISSERKSIVLRSPSTVTANTYFIIYSGVMGETAGKQIRLTNFKLEEGNKATAWSAAPEDVAEATQQEIDKASLYRKTTIIDATGLDQNKYYLVTLPANSKVRTHYEIDVALNPEVSGKPEWAGHNTGSFVLNVRWSAYGNGWGTTSTQRIVESFHYQWTDTDKYGTVIPAGEISQMTRSSREYIYVRGGAKYPITVWGYKHNNIVPTLHTTSLTLSGEVKESPKSELSTIPKAYMSDLNRLDQLFPKSNLVANGAVVGQMLGVTDFKNGSRIIAGFNATTTYGYDNTHGKLILFGGASSLSAMGSAPTRLYEDGCFVTSKLVATNANITGTITATNGRIGDFKITSNGYIQCQKNESTSILTNTQLLIEFSNTSLEYALNFGGDGSVDSRDNLVKIQASYNTNARIIGLYMDVKNGESPSRKKDSLPPYYVAYAIACVRGVFAGLRPYCRTITAPTTLTEFDHTVYCENAGTITLPRDPEEGQQYFIIKQGASTLRIQGNGHSMHRPMVSEASYYDFGKKNWGGLIIVIFLNNMWRTLILSADLY